MLLYANVNILHCKHRARGNMITKHNVLLLWSSGCLMMTKMMISWRSNGKCLLKCQEYLSLSWAAVAWHVNAGISQPGYNHHPFNGLEASAIGQVLLFLQNRIMELCLAAIVWPEGTAASLRQRRCSFLLNGRWGQALNSMWGVSTES